MASASMLMILNVLLLLITSATMDATDVDIGCYDIPVDPANRPVMLNPGQYLKGTLTVTECMALCKQLLSQYTLLTAGEVCQCAEAIPLTESVNDDICGASCPESCGGTGHYSAYNTPPKLGNIAIYRKTKSDDLQELSYDRLFDEANQVAVSVLDNVRFPFNFTGTENITLSMQFSDNYPINDVVLKSPSELDHLFMQPIVYPISGLAVDDITMERVDINSIVKAMMPVSNVSIVCPFIVGANHYFECTVTVMLGTSLQLNADYEVGNITINPVDASHTVYGISSWTDCDSETEPGYRYYIDLVKSAGVLVSWEFDVASNGTFLLEVYKPSAFQSLKACTDGGYSFRKRLCPNSNTVSWSDDVHFDLIYQFEYVADSDGKQWYIPAEDERIHVSKGDILAVASNDGRLKRSSNTVHEEYVSNIDNSAIPSLHTFNTLVQVTVAKPSLTKLQMKVPDPTDSYADDTDRIVFVNVENELSAVNTSTSVHIQSYINGVEIIGPGYKMSNESVTLYVPAHNGTDVVYEWNTGNGDSKIITENSTINYTWSYAGIYVVTVKAFNYISQDTTTFTIHIEDPVSDIVSWIPSTPDPRQPHRHVDVTNVTEAALLRWNVLSGTDYSVDVVLGNIETSSVSAPPRGFTLQDQVAVDGFHLTDVVLMNEDACLNKLELQELDGDQLTTLKAGVACTGCTLPGRSMTVDLNRMSTVLGIISTGYNDQVVDVFEISYSNDNHHFILVDDFSGGNYNSNLTTIFKNAFIARYVKVTIKQCTTGTCGIAIQVLGCEWSPVCRDYLDLTGVSTEETCQYYDQSCEVELVDSHTISGIVASANAQHSSFTVQYSMDDQYYLDLIDRSGVLMTFSSSVSDGSPVTHLFAESVIAHYIKILLVTDGPIMTFQMLGCKGSRVCRSGFGFESGIISSDSVTHSTSLDDAFLKLNDESFTTDTSEHWVSIDLGKPQTITGVVTQGCPESSGGTFTVEYRSNDDVWLRILNQDGNSMAFSLNSDITTKLSPLPYAIIARHFKMSVSSSQCFHFEPVGCFSPLICRTSLADQSSYETNLEVLLLSGTCWVVERIEWLLVDVGIQRSISGVLTKNLPEFQVLYSQERYNWISVVDENGDNKTFAVTDPARSTVNMLFKSTDFVSNIYARYFKFVSSNWPDGEVCLELIGCEGDGLLSFTSNTDVTVPVDVSISNRVSNVNISSEAFIQTPIADFQVHQTPILNLDLGHSIELTTAYGSDIHLNATFNMVYLEENDLQFNDVDNFGSCYLRYEIYPTYGNYVVSVTAENEVSGPRTDHITVHIQQEIVDLVMKPTKNYLSTNETMLLDYLMTNGTEVLLLFEFGDESSVEVYHSLFNGNTERVNHSYIQPDVYYINLYASNNISNAVVSYTVVVENPNVFNEILLTPNSPGRIDSVGTGNGTLYVQYDFLGDKHDFPTNATAVYFIAGMEFKQQNYSLVFNEEDKRTYHPLYMDTYGGYIIDIYITNHISQVNYTIDIEMEQPIENLAISTSNKYQRVDWNVTFLITTTWGSRITFVVDFGDSITYTTSNKTSFEVSHAYNDSGVYPVHVYAYNLIGNVSARMPTDQFIQYPVDGVRLHSREISLLPFDVGISGEVSVPFFVFQNQTIHLPTNVTFITYFNTTVDRSETSEIPLSITECTPPSSVFFLEGFDLVQCFDQVYTVEGDYNVCIKMWNEVSNGTACRQLTVLEQITQIKAHVYYIDTQENGTDSEQPAYVFEGKIYVPLDRVIKVKMTYWNGTGIKYFWDFNDTNSLNTTDVPEAVWKYTYPGIYEVMINSSNPVFFNVTSVTIRVQGAMRNLTITGPGPKDITQSVQFLLTATTFGTGVCYRFEYIDIEYLNSTVIFTGDLTMCRTQYNTTGKIYDEFINYDYLWLMGFNGESANLTVQHTFPITCIYNVTITAFNIVSDELTYTEQIITTQPCFFPEVSVQELNLCNENYNCDEHGYREFKSADLITVFGEVSISCQSTNIAYYNWTLVNSQGEKYSLPENVLVYGSPLPVLNIPRASFGTDYDTYSISLTVKMAIECGLETTDLTHITIVSSELQARIAGGSFRTFGNSSTLVIDASEETIDPDSQSVKDLDIYWFCRQKRYIFLNETFNNIEEFATDIDSEGSVDGQFQNKKEDEDWDITKGCFYYGSNKAGGELDQYRDELKFEVPIEAFQPGFNMEYQFKLLIKEGMRQATAFQSIYVELSDPPDVKIECSLNCQERTNPSGRFSLKSVLNSSHPEHHAYYWTFREINGTEEEKIEYNIWGEYSATGQFQANQVINRGLLTPGRYYRLDLIVTRDDGISPPAAAETRWEISANDFPEVGSCFIEPTDGVAVETLFMVECANFTDLDIPMSYEFSIISSNSSIWKTIYKGQKRKLPNPTELPQGDPPDYSLIVRVRAYDVYAACSEDYNMTVYVYPPDKSDEEVDEMIDKEVDDIRQLVGGGNIISSCNKATSLLKLLNSMAENCTCNDTLTDIDDVGYNATAELIKKAKRVDVRYQIIGYVNVLKPNDFGDLKVMISAVNEAVKVPDETLPEAKTTTITVLEKLAVVMSSQANEIVTSADAIEESGSNLLELLGSIQAPSAYDANITLNETLENNRRIQVVVDSMMSNILNMMVIGQDNVRVESSDITTSCSRASPDTLKEKKEFDQGNGMSMTLPDMSGEFNSSSDDIDIQVVAQKNNPYQYDNSSSLVSGRVVSMDMSTNGSKINVQNLTEKIEMIITRDMIEPATGENQTNDEVRMYGNTSAAGLKMTIMVFQDIERDKSLTINLESLGQKNMVIGESYNYSVFLYLRANEVPTEDYGQYDDLCTLNFQMVTPYEKYYSSDDEAYPRPWNDTHDYQSYFSGETKCFYSNLFLNSLSNQSSPTYYVGVRNKMGLNRTVNDTLDNSFQQMRFVATYFTSQCLYLDEETNSWKSDGMEVGPDSTRMKTQCFSNHLTSFGGGISVPINTVDLSSSPFASLNENPVVFVFMVCCMMLYFTVILWARKADQRDCVMAGVTPLKDNDPRHKIRYEITVFTGVKKKAGTSATVSFMIAGEEGETGIRVFQDEKRKIFERGNIDTFVLTTKRSLGQLIHIRIWHNNKGKHPSWFLSRISIKDLQTNRVFYFMLDKWLAVEEEDGQIERIIPVAGRSELTSFGHLFHSKTRRNLQDSHLWFSVFFRPSKSNFTRVQRATCCLSLLFSTMMANIIFYGVDMVSAGGPVVKVGPVELSLAQVVTGVISSLMVFPTSLFTVQLFRISEPKPEGARFFCPNKKMKIRKSEPNIESISLSTTESENKEMAKDQFVRDLMCERDNLETPSSEKTRPQSIVSRHSTASNNSVRIEMKSSLAKKSEEAKEHLVLGYKVKRKKRGKYILNWRFKYLAWFVAIGNIGVAFWLTILYAASFGKKKAEEWLTSIGIALIQDVLITQPIKVILIAVFFSLVIKNPIKEDDDCPPPPDLQDGEEFLHERMTEEELENAQMLEQFERERADTITSSMPPDDDEILEARETRFKEIRMHKIVREIIIYLLFLYVLMFVSYGNTDYNAFNLRQSMVDTFVNAAYNGKLKFNEALKKEQFWNWTDNVLVPSLFPEHSTTQNTEALHLVSDQQSYLIGVPLFRQLRIQKDKCDVPEIMQQQFKQDCRVAYSYGDEEVDDFLPSWKPISNISLVPNYEENSQIGSWKYHSWFDLKKLPYWGNVAVYSGGGYIAKLGSTSEESLQMISYLKESDWLDQYTRAIFIEFALYNPVMDFYTVSYLLADFLPQGGMMGYVDFKVTKLKTINNLNFIGYVLLALEAIFLLFVLWFTYIESKKFLRLRKKYFKEKENWVELITLAIAITAVFMYFYRLFESMKLVSERKETPTKLLNFQYVVQWEMYFKWMMGFVLFIFTIKFMKLLRFNYRLRLFCETVLRCWYEVLLFLIMFGVIFMAYTCCGYLFFSNALIDYVTVVTTMESLFSFLLGKFDFDSLVGVNRILGPLYFFSFAMISIFVLMNMFLTVIIEAFCVVKHSSSENIKNDLEIVDFMIHRFKLWTGFAEKRLKKPVKHYKYVDGIDPIQVDCDELKEKLTTMVDNLNYFIRKERVEHFGSDFGQSEERIIFTA